MPKDWVSRHWRLVLTYMLVFAVSVACLGAITYFSATDYIEAQLAREVSLSAEQLLVDYRQEGLEELRHDIGERIDLDHYDRLWYSLENPDGKIEFDPIGKMPANGISSLDKPKSLLVYVTDLKDGYRLAVATSRDDITAFQRALRNTFAFAIVATIVLGAVGGYILSRRYLLRVEEIRTAAEGFAEGKLQTRIPVKGNGDDFDQIATIINSMLVRIEGLLQEVKRVSTNIAHDLRTPIGRVRQKLELLILNPSLDPKAQEATESSILLLDETLQTFSALLRIAEIGSGVRRSGFATYNLSELVQQLSATYEVVAEDSNHELRSEIASGIEKVGDKSLIIQLVANLVENAIQHTPPQTKIFVKLRSTKAGAELMVEDNGPGAHGIPYETLVEPFFKGDSSRSRQGSGLGLSVVNAIVELHGLELKFENCSPGFRATVSFSNRSQA
ncbi:MAG: HAMP domain-containing protein [Proteobacteria bacterium]|nr:MAG: HAMP domain-containing protein [Pseudomonadota bacterium]